MYFIIHVVFITGLLCYCYKLYMRKQTKFCSVLVDNVNYKFYI